MRLKANLTGADRNLSNVEILQEGLLHLHYCAD